MAAKNFYRPLNDILLPYKSLAEAAAAEIKVLLMITTAVKHTAGRRALRIQRIRRWTLEFQKSYLLFDFMFELTLNGFLEVFMFSFRLVCLLFVCCRL